MKIAVIGAGISGLSAAKTLSQRGHQVELHEQFHLFHDRGSSHGASRIIRRAYPDAFYTACMAEAYPMWRNLEMESSRTLVHECGLLYFGDSNSENMDSMAQGLMSLDVPFETLDCNQVKRTCKDLRLLNTENAIWTPEAGWVNAAAALVATYDIARTFGLEVRIGAIADPMKLAAENDVVIVTAGAWTTRFAPVPVQVNLQTFAYIEADIDGPVWIEDSYDNPYGFPSDEIGQKIGIHRPGTPIDPDQPSRATNPALIDIIKETATRRFGVVNPVVKESKGCLYTTTKNEDFLMGNLAPNVFFASACSGHGFKMGPWVGKLLADFAEGKDNPANHPRFLFEP